MQIDWLTE